ncbi:MAG: hypothetical protein ABFS22_11660 [Pseudomonadota bacterium]
MNKDEIPGIARKNLACLLNESGSILYSSHETLKPNDVYLLGFNPGGEGGNTLSSSIDQLLENQANAYLDECWGNRNASWKKGEAPLQKRVCWLLERLGFEPREVCASNLIFLRSRDAKGINYRLAEQCWPVHEAIMKIVKPKLILAFGNSKVSPYRYLYRMFGGTEEDNTPPSGHGNWRIRGFETEIDNQPIYVAGLPHLSRYNITGQESVIDWLKSN